MHRDNSFVRGKDPAEALDLGTNMLLKEALQKLLRADNESQFRIRQIKIHEPWGLPIVTITGHFHSSITEYLDDLIKNNISEYIHSHSFQTFLNDNGRFEFYYLINKDYRKKGFSLTLIP